MRFAPSDTADHINLNKIFQRPSSSLKNVFLAEIGSEQVFARILHWQYFRLFQQNRQEQPEMTARARSGDPTARLSHGEPISPDP
jgi:hypothetical protein